jgi:hypothetical protein
MMNSLLVLSLVGLVLVLVQAVAALPWALLLAGGLPSWVRHPVADFDRQRTLTGLALLALALVLGPVVLGFLIRDPVRLQIWGGVYGAVLQIQLTVDLFVLVFAVLLQVWPKGAAVALAAFREGLRHPMFWFLLVLALVLMGIMPILPYFTFGEDYKMVKDLGYSTIMLSPGMFAVLAASMLISEEIEGRTAVTLMSKPVSRRQFLLGKFAGLLLAALAMTGILSWFFDGLLLFKLWYDKETITPPDWLAGVTNHWVAVAGEPAAYFLRGGAWWGDHVVSALPGVILGFCQVMVLLAIAVALATRLPMIVNVNSCVVIFFLGNLTPVLTQVSQASYPLVRFVAQLFDTLLPSLEFFNLGPAIASDTLPDPGKFSVYIGYVVLYALLYSLIALLVGLILFEDRDLA